jgi:hypothetical protein
VLQSEENNNIKPVGSEDFSVQIYGTEHNRHRNSSATNDSKFFEE